MPGLATHHGQSFHDAMSAKARDLAVSSISRVQRELGLSSAVPEQAGRREPPAGEGLDDVDEGGAKQWWPARRDLGAGRGGGAGCPVTAEPAVEGGEMGSRDRLGGVEIGRQAGEGGFRAIRDRSLNFLCADAELAVTRID